MSRSDPASLAHGTCLGTPSHGARHRWGSETRSERVHRNLRLKFTQIYKVHASCKQIFIMMMTFGPKRPTLSKIPPPQRPQHVWWEVQVDCCKIGQLCRMISYVFGRCLPLKGTTPGNDKIGKYKGTSLKKPKINGNLNATHHVIELGHARVLKTHGAETPSGILTYFAY